MKLDRKQDLNALYQVCVFWADWKNKMAALALWLAETFSTSPLKPQNGIQRNLTGSKLSMPSTTFVFFRQIGEKTKWPPWPLIGWDIFDFSSETVKGIWRNLIGSKISTPSTKFLFSGGSEKQNRRPGLWFAETFSTFPLKPLNRIQQNLTEARSQHPLPGLRFSGWSEKQDSSPVLWLAETFLTSSMKPLNRIQRNLTESKFSTSSTKFVFFWLIQKTIWAALASDWLRHILTFPLKRLNGIQRNLTGSKILVSSTKFVFFGLKRKSLANPSKKVAHCTQVHVMGPFGPLVYEFI